MAAIEGFYRELGARLRQSRQQRGLTQSQVAARVAPPVTRASIANLELGQQRVLVHTLVQLADILETPISDFLQPGSPAAAGWPAVEEALRGALHLSRARAQRLARRLAS